MLCAAKGIDVPSTVAECITAPPTAANGIARPRYRYTPSQRRQNYLHSCSGWSVRLDPSPSPATASRPTRRRSLRESTLAGSSTQDWRTTLPFGTCTPPASSTSQTTPRAVGCAVRGRATGSRGGRRTRGGGWYGTAGIGAGALAPPRLAGAYAAPVATCAPTTAQGRGMMIRHTSCATRAPVGRATGADGTSLGSSASRQNAWRPCTTPTAS